MKFDIAIIGAGIVGAACALRLSEEGLKVAVIEANEIAGGSTAAGMGHLVVMDDSEAQFALTNYSQKLWSKLASQLPNDCEYENCGTIWIAADGEELEEVKRKKDFYDARGVHTEILDEKSLREAEPNLRNGLAGGLLVSSDGVVYQLRVTHHLLNEARKLGAMILTGKRAVEISESGVSLEDGDFIPAGKIVNATGYWSGDLQKNLKIVKRKGHLVITDRYPNFVRHPLIELGYLKSAHSSENDSVAFNVQPRMTGQLIIGSSRQFGAKNTSINHGNLRRMMDRAFEYMPNLKQLSAIRVWTGFRPATPDNLPYIGELSKNIYLATGHEGLGITTSLGTAEILTDEIIGRESEIDRKPFSPRRFGK